MGRSAVLLSVVSLWLAGCGIKGSRAVPPPKAGVVEAPAPDEGARAPVLPAPPLIAPDVDADELEPFLGPDFDDDLDGGDDVGGGI